MAKTSQMDEQITRDIIDQHGLYARFGVDRMTVDRFTQIFYMVWKAAEDALDLTRNLRHALDPFDAGAAGSSASGAAMFLARRRFIFSDEHKPDTQTRSHDSFRFPRRHDPGAHYELASTRPNAARLTEDPGYARISGGEARPALLLAN